jgi:hypothetical protein
MVEHLLKNRGISGTFDNGNEKRRKLLYNKISYSNLHITQKILDPSDLQYNESVRKKVVMG